jgi:hypothetical protein
MRVSRQGAVLWRRLPEEMAGFGRSDVRSSAALMAQETFTGDEVRALAAATSHPLADRAVR